MSATVCSNPFNTSGVGLPRVVGARGEHVSSADEVMGRAMRDTGIGRVSDKVDRTS